MKTHIGNVPSAHQAWVISAQARHFQGLTVVIADNSQHAAELIRDLPFFLSADAIPLYHLPDWETLPYDQFSPEAGLISDRLEVLRQLLFCQTSVLITAAQNLINPMAPRTFIEQSSTCLTVGQALDLTQYCQKLESLGYQHTAQVMAVGEFAVRGSVLDLYPTGSKQPYRIDWFDDTLDSIRSFDPETQKSTGKTEEIRILPAHEFPLTTTGCTQFLSAWRAQFPHLSDKHPMAHAIANHLSYQGIEYYLPLFFETVGQLTDYLPEATQLIVCNTFPQACETYWQQIETRYAQNRHNLDRPCLPPAQLFQKTATVFQQLKAYPQIQLHANSLEKINVHRQNFGGEAVVLNTTEKTEPLNALADFLQPSSSRVLFVAESAGRREVLLEKLHTHALTPKNFTDLAAFISDTQSPYGITVAPFPHSLYIPDLDLCIISEHSLLKDPRIPQSRPARHQQPETHVPIYDLGELQPGHAVVHLEHGVGRYQGLTCITLNDQPQEFLTLGFADDNVLYVPIHNLHLISRYSIADLSQAPLHRLGSDRWEKTKQKATQHLRDVAAELLDIQARRAATEGFAYQLPHTEYAQFCANFPFEETEDQQQAILAIQQDMAAPQAMDRLLCGDVGFGKTEVAMRASFIAAHNHKQVAILVPTTLLAQQHYENFCDRFADQPIQIEMLSRFRSTAETQKIRQKLADHQIDIIIGTHQLLSKTVTFADLGLLIIDEEHRFGVRQKERMKSLRAHVDILSMTATPIPRTLNLSLSALRDLSIISTPPVKRLSVKTFVHEASDSIIREAIARETARGGQVFFLHNDVQTIEKTAAYIQDLMPQVSIAIAHGQMRERQLEKTMRDFYHNRQQVLVCSTIIETGIDIPNANTIIIHHADRFGLAQLHQLRGRVGRAHHQAYAYLLCPPMEVLTRDAQKRLEAITAADHLGAGFTLASHDLEIRGAGELLGESQSGNMHAIGLGLYLEILERTVRAVRSGKKLTLEDNFNHSGCEVELPVVALIPEDYLPDVQMRLQCYKRLSACTSQAELERIQIDMIDRFGLLPEALKNLMAQSEIRLLANALGMSKIRAHAQTGTIYFGANPRVNFGALIQLIQKQPTRFQLKGEQQLNFQHEATQDAEYFEVLRSILSQLR